MSVLTAYCGRRVGASLDVCVICAPVDQGKSSENKFANAKRSNRWSRSSEFLTDLPKLVRKPRPGRDLEPLDTCVGGPNGFTAVCGYRELLRPSQRMICKGVSKIHPAIIDTPRRAADAP